MFTFVYTDAEEMWKEFDELVILLGGITRCSLTTLRHRATMGLLFPQSSRRSMDLSIRITLLVVQIRLASGGVVFVTFPIAAKFDTLM